MRFYTKHTYKAINVNKIIKKFIENKSETNQYLSMFFLFSLLCADFVMVQYKFMCRINRFHMAYNIGIICINLDQADVGKYFHTKESHVCHIKSYKV